MSFHAQNLEAFLQLLKEQPKLFPDSKRQELTAILEPLNDDVETLSVAIAKWYEKYDEIVDAQLEILNDFMLTKNISPQQSSSPAALLRFNKTPADASPEGEPRLNKDTLLLYLR